MPLGEQPHLTITTMRRYVDQYLIYKKAIQIFFTQLLGNLEG